MWQIKTFKTKLQMESFMWRNRNKFQIEEVFINNGFGVEYKPLKIIHA